MNSYIWTFLFFGAFVGGITFSQRHLFSEGPRKLDNPGEEASTGTRAFWIGVCTFLWPVILLTGLNTAWILAKRRRQVTISRN